MQDQVSVDLYIDGRWMPAEAGETVKMIDPATEEQVGSFAQAQSKDVLKAIEAAERAFATWSKVPAWERSNLLRKAASLLAERSEQVARRITLECGKPFAQAKGEVQASVECIDWFADEARRIYGQILPGRTANSRFTATYEPVGVVAAFTAWNFPVVLQARKIAPALAAGCTIVSRPAEEGSGAVALLIKCFIDAGVPAGVVNLLTGTPQVISETVMDSDIVRKVTFTGSIPVGQHLMRRAADTVKRMSMELGGHSPVIVHEDVDPAKAAMIAAQGKFRNNGQVCVSPTRFYVHEKHKDAFTENFLAAAKAMKMGNGFEDGVEIGPLINRRRLEFIEQMVEDTKKDGGTLVMGGKRPADMNRGYFFEPTVFTDVPDDARIMNDEPFGPIAPLSTFSAFDEVIERANALPYGLAAYVFTDSLKLAQQTSQALKVGIVAVNNTAAATAEMPFGGVKHSGFGRENGSQGLLDYLDVKFTNFSF
ncbi:NAD-dependent succinate-semialdehyde dehydrogenase [Marinimicrococcus flavescens]|uniref:NAD-dependent succinate-semialdehyde dehydrogenase n=1 Tax=Marinimicrococcus flavescens TaxID=3031815 RepID=A0AAP3XRK2_9PROT|nr:NAD-dependent succinate-semialdehyde dehydrogenase [Marinimicrococcus flavescens]